jgi:serine phosphatase RsbU (regulator of sigma subunit)
LLVDPDGAVRLLPLPPSIPLGAGSDDRRSLTVPLPPGAAVLAFTDGLVERRTEDIDEGLQRLVESAASFGVAELPSRLTELVAALRDDERQDDVTVLVAQRTPSD